jgi:hypothetical protein
MIEVWKDISVNDNYQVSSLGRIRSLDHYVYTIYSKNNLRLVTGRIRKLGNHNHGYKCVNLNKNSSYLVHRLVADAFLAKVDGKDFVNHKDGDKHNNTVDNLEWCTRQENEDHAYGTGLKNSTGSNNEMAKLNEVNVVNILKRERSSKEYAEQYNVHPATINRILSRKIWKHVTV